MGEMSSRDKRTLKYAAATDVRSKDYMYPTDPHDMSIHNWIYNIEYNSKEVSLHTKGTNARMSRHGSLYAHVQ